MLRKIDRVGQPLRLYSLEAVDTRLWHPFADMGSVRAAELVIERGEDVWVWDREGRRYLDATASLWYANVGHGRPEIAKLVAFLVSEDGHWVNGQVIRVDRGIV